MDDVEVAPQPAAGFNVEVPEELPPVYHETPNKFHYLNSNDGYWQEMTQDTVKSLLTQQFNRNPVPPRGGGLSEVDRTILQVKMENRVAGVVRLGWEEEGIRMIDGKRFIVERGATKIQPAQGDWSHIGTYLVNLFGETQIEYVLGWLQNAVVGFYYPDRRKFGQVLILAGPAGSGKSFFQMRVVTPALGGKIGRPYQWLTGQTEFNSELFEAIHLISEDDFKTSDKYHRKEFGAAIKRLTANTTQEYNQKHGTKTVIQPYWRTSISLNGELHYLAALPELDDSIIDKMIIVQCSPNAIHLKTHGDNGNEMERAMREQMPAFIHYLLHGHRIPLKLRNPRFGVNAYIHPEVKAAMDRMADEYQLLDYLRLMYPGGSVTKASNTIQRAIRRDAAPKHIELIASRPSTFEEAMKRIAKMPNSGVKAVMSYGATKWKMEFPERSPDEKDED